MRVHLQHESFQMNAVQGRDTVGSHSVPLAIRCSPPPHPSYHSSLLSVGEAAPPPLEGPEPHVAGVERVDDRDGHPPDAVLQAQPAEPHRRADEVAPAGEGVHFGQEVITAGRRGGEQHREGAG